MSQTTTTAAVTAAGVPFTTRVYKATRGSHEISDLIVASKLAVVLTDKPTYGRALSCFLPVYQAIEEKVTRLKDKYPQLAPLAAVVVKLQRKALMEQDLAYLLGADWRSKLSRTCALDKYVQHLNELEQKDPILLAAYAYSMHVPLLLGPIKKIVRRTLGLEKDGLAFLDVSDDQYRNTLITELRGALNTLASSFDEPFIQRYIAETNNMYKLNNDLVLSFATGYWASMKAVPSLVYTLSTTFLPRNIPLTVVTIAACSIAVAVRYWKSSSHVASS